MEKHYVIKHETKLIESVEFYSGGLPGSRVQWTMNIAEARFFVSMDEVESSFRHEAALNSGIFEVITVYK